MLQAKLQDDVSRWVSERMEAMSDVSSRGVIQETLQFVDLLRLSAHELTPSDHAVVRFLQQLDVNCYEIASRRIDVEVRVRIWNCELKLGLAVSKRRKRTESMAELHILLLSLLQKTSLAENPLL